MDHTASDRVVRWLALLPHYKKAVASTPTAFLCGVCMFRFSLGKDVHIRLIGNSKLLAAGVNVSPDGCLSALATGAPTPPSAG